MNKNLRIGAAITLAGALATGCAGQTKTEREFGVAVRAVQTAQIYDMGAALYPDKEAVTGGNADRLENVVKAHASDVAETSPAQAPVSTSINGGSQ